MQVRGKFRGQKRRQLESTVIYLEYIQIYFDKDKKTCPADSCSRESGGYVHFLPRRPPNFGPVSCHLTSAPAPYWLVRCPLSSAGHPENSTLVFNLPTFSHTMPFLRTLHWLRGQTTHPSPSTQSLLPHCLGSQLPLNISIVCRPGSAMVERESS